MRRPGEARQHSTTAHLARFVVRPIRLLRKQSARKQAWSGHRDPSFQMAVMTRSRCASSAFAGVGVARAPRGSIGGRGRVGRSRSRLCYPRQPVEGPAMLPRGAVRFILLISWFYACYTSLISTGGRDSPHGRKPPAWWVNHDWRQGAADEGRTSGRSATRRLCRTLLAAISSRRPARSRSRRPPSPSCCEPRLRPLRARTRMAMVGQTMKYRSTRRTTSTTVGSRAGSATGSTGASGSRIVSSSRG